MSQEEDNIEERANWHWRNSMQTVRFFGFDARAGIMFFALLIYFRPITLILTLLSTIVFWLFEKAGLTFPSALRSMRLWLIGQKRPAWIKVRHRRIVDYG